MGNGKRNRKVVPCDDEPSSSIGLSHIDGFIPGPAFPQGPVFVPDPGFRSGPPGPSGHPFPPAFDIDHNPLAHHPFPCPGYVASAPLYPGVGLGPGPGPGLNQNYPPPPYVSSPEPLPTGNLSEAGTRRSSMGSAIAFPPPLPPRERVLIGRHAARFDLKTPPDSGRSAKDNNGSRIHKKFINPMVYSRRGCTDVVCCLLFMVFVAAWCFVAVLGYMWGKPELLIHPADSEGRLCGAERTGSYDLRSKPYLLYFDITKCVSYSVVFAGCQTPQMCVAECPTKTFTYLQMQTVPAGSKFQAEVRSNIICRPDVPMHDITDFTTLRSYVDQRKCAPYTVPSAAVLNRCVPSIILNVGNAVKQAQSSNSTLDRIVSTFGNGGGLLPTAQQLANSSKVVGSLVGGRSVLEKVVHDLSVTWWQILAMFGITAIIALLFVVAMRILGKYVVWLTILFVVLILGAGSGYSVYRFKTLHDAGAVNDYTFQPDINVYFEMPTTWMVIAIVLGAFLLIVVVILLLVRSRIKIAVALIQESSKAIGSIMASLLFPFFPFILHLLIFVVWATVTIWLATSGTENCLMPRTPGGNLTNGLKCDCNLLGKRQGFPGETQEEIGCQYVNMTRDENRIFAMQAFNLFGFFWLTCFVSALADMTLAGAFASYYWAFNKPKDVPSFPIMRAFGRAIRYHLGTIAFGSLILAIVKFIRAILDYLQKKLSMAQNPVAKFFLACLKCFFWCLESFLKFLTRNAYIMTAIYGRNFCTSSKDSFTLILENIVRYTVLDNVTDFLLFLGKATVTLGMGVVAFFWFSGRWVINGLPHIDLYYYFVPIIVVLVGAYFISDSFFDVYQMAVDTTFLCFLEDAKQNNGTPDKPYYMSRELQRILGKHNEFNAQPK